MKKTIEQQGRKLWELCMYNRLWGSAAELTYYLLFAFFPFLMFLAGIFSLVGGEQGSLFARLLQFLPEAVQNLLSDYSVHLYDMPGSMPLILGAGMTLYSLTRAFQVLGFHVRRMYGRTGRRRAWVEVRQSGLFTVAFMILILLNFGLIVCGRLFLTLLDRFTSVSPAFLQWLEIGRFVLPIAIGFLFVLQLYRLLPGGGISYQEALPGTIFCMLAWSGATIAFSAYVDDFARYSLLYGSVSAAIILVVWLNLSSLLLLFGAQLNGFLRKEKPRKSSGD